MILDLIRNRHTSSVPFYFGASTALPAAALLFLTQAKFKPIKNWKLHLILNWCRRLFGGI